MSFLCLVGIHSYENGYVRFTEPLMAGKFDRIHPVELRQRCTKCSKMKIFQCILPVEGQFNLLPRNTLDKQIDLKIEDLYKSGNSVNEIAFTLNVSVSTVRRRLKHDK